MTEWRGGERERQSEMEKDLNERVGKGRMGKENESDNGREGKEKKSGLRKKEKKKDVCKEVGAVNCMGEVCHVRLWHHCG